jgi:diguanylate cyclase
VNIKAQISPNLLRPAAVFVGLATYVVFTWWLQRAGLLQLDENLFLLLIPLWVMVFVGLVVLPGVLQKLDEDTVVLCRTLWCNLGAVVLAVLVSDPMRLLLLIVPLFSVIYAAVHLARSQVLLVVLATALIYSLCVLYLLTFNRADAEFEVMSGVAFAALLSGVLLLAADLQNLRDALLERNQGLREAMERLQDMALKDDLTGLHNRRSILEVLSRQKALADRGQQAFTLCYADLDHFKLINDRFGHAVGDVALHQFAELAQSVVRNVDYVARFGGEEFLMVLVDADEATASQVAHRLAERTRDMWVPGTDESFKLSVSVGIARYRSGERVDDVISRADHALYAAKRGGRDLIVVAPERA